MLRKSKFVISPWTLVLFFICFLIWSVLVLQNVRQQLDQIQDVVLSPQHNKQNSKGSKEFTINSPATTKGMVHRHKITIEGEADNNAVVMLLEGDRLLQAVQPQKNRFVFENIKLSRGQNEFYVQLLTPDGGKIALEKFTFTYNSPTMSYLAKSLDRGNVNSPYVALTFDGGYINNISAEILDYLYELQIRATFFLTGKYVTSFPETVLRMVNEGHEVGNHTMNHPHFTTFSEDGLHNTRPEVTYEMVRQELGDMAEAFFKVTGQKVSPIWRAPFGEHNVEIRNWAAELGYRQIGWTDERNGNNMDTMDWIADPTDKSYMSAEQIRNKILNFASETNYGAAGAIILMHLGSQRSDDFPHHKLPEIVSGLQKKGYQFVTISQMIEDSFY